MFRRSGALIPMLVALSIFLSLGQKDSVMVSAFVVAPSVHLQAPHHFSLSSPSFSGLRHRHRVPSLHVSVGATATPNGITNGDDEESKAMTMRKTRTEKIPFIVEALPDQPNPALYGEIASMCITAFFNDGDPHQVRTMPWKEFQLKYLRRLQQNDLRRRRSLKADSNVMLVARRVVPADAAQVRTTTPLILDLSQVYNLNQLQQKQSRNSNNNNNNNDFVRGEVLGFVEVTNKPYGLGMLSTAIDTEGEDEIELRKSLNVEMRPVLTNLSVVYNARQSGVGSKLVERCEKEVCQRWARNEIVLEVEEDNLKALEFYKKRGYKVLFEDPTSRRYDVSGLWLSQKRCKRFIMRKVLAAAAVSVPGVVVPAFPKEVKFTFDKGMETLRKLRDNVLQTS